MPTELAVGYISLVTDASKIPKEINAALGVAGRDADKHGAQIGQRMGKGAKPGLIDGIKSGLGLAGKDADNHGERIGKNMGKGVKSGLLGSVGTLGATLGLSLGAATFGKIITVGNDFTTALNTMRAVSSATANEMAQVSARAKELGNDVALPGTSASDAAAAMLELAKGGFSVRQSMDAARGSLQLAAAAGIGAAEAATIQVGALQAFGLAATDAGRVADVLANTANASSAEITDVAYALQSGGAVAHQFGLTVEDTAAAIGLFANSGIKGSDAGTLLKSALLALTDTGNPAQAAIKQLGLTVYDAQGRFVGLSSLFGQLDTAAGRMTDQQYQAATSVLFGSDAMRLASIAAEKGSAGFDQMHDAMSRQGSAASVAAAKMQGLPGAMQSVQNAAEGLALGIYEVVKGPMEQFARGAAGFITEQTPNLVNGLKATGAAIGDVGGFIAPVVKGFLDLPAPVLAATAALVALRVTGIGSSLSSAIGTTSGALRGFSDQMALQRSLAAASGQSIGAFGSAIATLEARVPVLGRMSEAFHTASASATVFARTQGTVAAASTGLRSAVGGVVGALGGPWALALTAGVAALTANVQSAQSAKSAQRALADATAAGARAQADFANAVALANGGLSEQALSAGGAAVQASLAQVTTLGERGHTAMEQLGHQIDNITGNVFGSNDAWEDNYDKVTASEEQYNALRKVMGDLKLDMNGVGRVVTQGGPAYDSLISKLQASGDAGKQVAATLSDVHGQLESTARAAQTATPGFFNLAASVKILADQSSSAADRVNAMRTALEIMSGKPVAVQDALARYNEQVRNTATATQEAWDKSQGFGTALVGQGGQVDTATENGKRLYDELIKIRDATITAAEAGANMDPILARNGQQFQQLATASGLSADQVRVMAEQLGLLPQDIQILAQLRGADTVEQQLVTISGMLQANAAGVDIPVDALTEETRKKLQELGVDIDAVNGKPGVVHISAQGDTEVMRKLDELIAKQLPDKTQRINVQYLTRDETLRNAGVSTDFVGPVAPEVRPRAAGGIDNLPGQGTIWSPKTRYYQVSEPETGGEAFIPLAQSKRGRSEKILSRVAEMFGFQLTAMAEGGITGKVPRGVARALAGARSVTGSKYVWGGTGPTGFDCSGFVGWLQQLLMGITNSTQRLYTTYSLLGRQTGGLKSGLGPASTWFRVGVNQEHMAATLAGQPVESGGSHGDSRIGAPAVGATDGQFTAHFYLPNELIEGIGEAGVSASGRRGKSKKQKEWTESDDIDLEQAQLGVEEAKARRDEVYKNPKSDELDKRRADLSVREAETRLLEKQKEKDGIAAESSIDDTIPEAPPLEKRLNDDEIEWEQAQLDRDEAKDRRDEVYADPESTDRDTRRADLQLQSAENQLDKIRKERDKKSLAGQTQTLLQKAGTELLNVAAGAFSEMLPFGFGDLVKIKVNNPWEYDPADHAPVRLAKFTGSQEEIDRQLPVSTGGDPLDTAKLLQPYIPQAPPSIQDWIQGLPLKVFDQGGWLEPGEMAVNLSRRPEPIFNSPQQLRQFLDVIPAPAREPERAGVGDTYQFNGMDPKSSAAAVERIRRRRLLADQRKGGFGR